MTQTVPSAAGGTGVARFKEETKGLTPPSNPTRRGVFLTDVIVELGFADQDRVDAVVEAARNSKKTVEELLLEHGAVDEDQLYRAIAERNGLDHVDLEEFECDPEAIERIGSELVLRHSAAPIALSEDGALIVAVADPFDSMTISDIEEAAECEVRLAIARPRAIRRLLRRLHGGGPMPDDFEADEPAEEVQADETAEETQVVEPAEEFEEPQAEEPAEEVEEQEAEEPGEEVQVEEPDARSGTAAGAPVEVPPELRNGNGAAAQDEDLRRVTRRAQRVEGELIVARRQLADLKRQLTRKGPNANLERAYTELEREKADLEDANVELERANAELEGANVELRRTGAALEEANAELKRANVDLDKTRAGLVAENAELQSRLGELVAWGAEVASAAEEAARVSASLDALREAVERNPAG